jgi:hypothetical protein
LIADPRRRYAAMGVGLVAAVALIGGQVWDQSRFEDLRGEPAALGLAAVLTGCALWAATATFVRVPAAFVIAVFAVMSLRVPVQVGGETNFLLVPLYGVIAGGWLRGAWLAFRGHADELQQDASPSPGLPPVVRWLCVALAAYLVLYAIGVAWSDDPINAIRNVAFFLAPFAVLAALLRDIRWYRKLVGNCVLAFVVVSAAFAVLALWQYGTRDLLLNKDLEDANQLHEYFRVNSLFRDPNVLGRYLAFAVIALAAWVGWQRPKREAIVGALIAALMLAAMTFTYSQTSFAALVAGLSALLWFRLGLKGLLTAVGLVLVTLGVFAALGGSPESTLDKKRDDLGEVSSNRTSLIEGGIDMFTDRPLEGYGSGSFAASFRKEVEKTTRPISHTEPVTVVAEQGVIGLIPYAAVIVLSIIVMISPWPGPDPIRAGIAAAYGALLVHSLGYAGYWIDPATWVLLALAFVARELSRPPPEPT